MVQNSGNGSKWYERLKMVNGSKYENHPQIALHFTLPLTISCIFLNKLKTRRSYLSIHSKSVCVVGSHVFATHRKVACVKFIKFHR